MHVSAYERDGSPFVYIQYRLSPSHRKKAEATNIRKDDKHKAKKIEAAIARWKWRLLTRAAKPEEAFTERKSWGWVPGYLITRYGKASRTSEVYGFQWGVLARFLMEKKILSPADLSREHCAPGYVMWRTSQVKEKSKRSPSVNTAIGELKLLALLMDEAVQMGLADENPCRKLRIRKAEPKVKPEFTDEQAIKVYAALESKPLWMQRSFHLALQTGLRFSETRIQRSQVMLDDGLLQIENPKGGRGKAFSIPIYPGVREMIEQFAASGEPELWGLPKNLLDFASMEWRKFFNSLGMPDHCFHCTRVTFITRGARAGVPESAMMALVNHGSADIHRVYRRFRGADALKYLGQMRLPSPPAAGARE